MITFMQKAQPAVNINFGAADTQSGIMMTVAIASQTKGFSAAPILSSSHTTCRGTKRGAAYLQLPGPASVGSADDKT